METIRHVDLNELENFISNCKITKLRLSNNSYSVWQKLMKNKIDLRDDTIWNNKSIKYYKLLQSTILQITHLISTLNSSEFECLHIPSSVHSLTADYNDGFCCQQLNNIKHLTISYCRSCRYMNHIPPYLESLVITSCNIIICSEIPETITKLIALHDINKKFLSVSIKLLENLIGNYEINKIIVKIQ